MKKLYLALFAFILMMPGVYGFVIYDIQVNEDESVSMSIKLELTSENKINYWNVVFLVPEGSDIISVNDSRGEIPEGQYELNGNELKIETNSGPARNTELVNINLRLQDGVDNKFEPLLSSEFSLAGFEGEETVVDFRAPERIITTNTPFGFNLERKRDSVKMSGTGALRLVSYYSDEGETYDNYVLFGEGDLSDADELNQIVGRIIGALPFYKAFPVVVLDDSDYERYNEEFSAASARTGGVIVAREGDINKDSFTATLLHETTHAYTFQLLNWDNTKASWFDEGVASYVEWAANELQGVQQAEIFGEDVRDRDGLTITTYPSRGNPEDLWNYYEDNNRWMRDWNPRDTDAREEITFGYAFSELQIREHVFRNGPKSIHDIFDNLVRVDNFVDNNLDYNEQVLGVMGSDMRACYFGSGNRDDFDECLDEINDMDPQIPEAPSIASRLGEPLNTTKLLQDAQEKIDKEKNQTTLDDVVYGTRTFVQKIIDGIIGFFSNIFGKSSPTGGMTLVTP